MKFCKKYPKCGCKGLCKEFEKDVKESKTALAKEVVAATMYEQALLEAAEEVGVREEGGDNRGKRVQEYQKEGGTVPGQPWCAAFVNWCARDAAKKLKLESSLEKVPLQAYVQSYVDHFRKVEGGFLGHRHAKVGDLFVLWYDKLNRFGHIGFVKEIDRAKGEILTIEGNSNDQLSREGDAVVSKTRKITPNMKFIRWA